MSGGRDWDRAIEFAEKVVGCKPTWRCRLFGHKYSRDDGTFNFVSPDPRPREFNTEGHPLLRKALVRCVRCGATSE